MLRVLAITALICACAYGQMGGSAGVGGSTATTSNIEASCAACSSITLTHNENAVAYSQKSTIECDDAGTPAAPVFWLTRTNNANDVTLAMGATHANLHCAIVVNRPGGGTGSGVSTFAALTDKVTADLPTINTPLSTALSGKAASSHNHAAADINSGTIGTARLGSGTADATTYLRGDQSWQTISGTGHTIADETTPLTARTNLRFQGTGVACADNAGANATDCTINAGAAVAAGSNGQIQINSAGALAGRTVGSGLTDDGTNIKVNASAVKTFLSGTASLTHGAIAGGACASQTITVTGAALGDPISVGPPAEILTFMLFYQVAVSAADTVTVRLCNPTAGSITPTASISWTVVVWRSF